MGLLDGRAAVVTGSAQGLGLAMAREFTRQGARVVISYINAEGARAAAEKLAAEGAQAISQVCDVTDQEEVAALVQRCVDEFGAVDVMVNNAGVTRDKTMAKMSVEDFATVINIHLQGAWLGAKAAGAHMSEQGSGSIINISSISGKIGNFGQTNYSAAKAGIVGLTKAAARELARNNVRVNAIMPGLIRTAMTEAMPREVFESKIADIPLARAGEPLDVANAATFLASDMASYLTGIVIEVSGGRHM